MPQPEDFSGGFGCHRAAVSVKRIAARVHLGSYHTANRNLHAWMKPAGKRKAK
jgi:hypothetical protein